MIKNLSSLWRNEPEGRVFISYRREDTQWFAGRLADSLSSYFGDKRVFRDVDGIKGGADFGDVIRGTLKQTDATIILIGEKWLSVENDQGESRLNQPDDWVAQEVVTALDAGIPVYPVLVGNTPMPRSSELPESLQPLLSFNAISISDNRWENDVKRLAKIIGLDIPSETERKLSGLNLLVSLSLALTLLICFVAMFYNMACHIRIKISETAGAISQAGALCSAYALPEFNSSLEHWPFDLRISAIPMIAIPCCSALLFVFAKQIDHTQRRWFLAAAWAGALGTIMAFIALWPVPEPYESLAMLLAATIIILAMFVFMCLSGFRPK